MKTSRGRVMALPLPARVLINQARKPSTMTAVYIQGLRS
jgi:hypothetical protein